MNTYTRFTMWQTIIHFYPKDTTVHSVVDINNQIQSLQLQQILFVVT